MAKSFSMFVSVATLPTIKTPSTGCAETSKSKPPKQRIRARVAYDGSNYKGWQFQVHHQTVQGTLEDSLSRKFKQLVRVVGASRTDTGVHARGQAVHFDIPAEQGLGRNDDVQKLQFTLNQMLPSDIRISNVSLAPQIVRARFSDGYQSEGDDNAEAKYRQWHAMYNAKGKLYSYRICTGPICDPLERLYRHFEWRAAKFGFSEDLFKQATHKFIGSHDFSAFTNNSCTPPGFERPVLINPVRTVRTADVIKEKEDMYRIDFSIDGAMYRMIRNIVGTILDVSCGRMELSSIDDLFLSKDRRLVPKSAPAKGLCLENVFYDDWDL